MIHWQKLKIVRRKNTLEVFNIALFVNRLLRIQYYETYTLDFINFNFPVWIDSEVS